MFATRLDKSLVEWLCAPVILLVLLGLPGTVRAQADESTSSPGLDDLIRLAQDEYTAGQYDASYRYWLVLIERTSPVPVDWHFYAGDAAERADRCTDAERHFRTALGYDELGEAVQNRLMQRIETVQACTARLIERQRANLIRDAEEAMRANEFARAAELFAEAAAIRNDASLPLHTARALELNGQLEESLALLDETSVVQQGMNHDLYDARRRRLEAELRGEPLNQVRVVTQLEPRRGLRVAGWTLLTTSAVATATAVPLARAADADAQQGCSSSGVCLPSADQAVLRRRRATVTAIAASALTTTSVIMLIMDATKARRDRRNVAPLSWTGTGIRLQL